MTDEETPVETPAPEAEQVESETTPPSTSETQTASETEMSEEPTSEAPAEEEKKLPRSEKRIQELTRKNKELEEKASYWDALNAQPPTAPPSNEENDGTVTVDGIADAVLRKQQIANFEQVKYQAQDAMQRDALAALTAHPELESDNELADLVVAYAKEKKISFKAAADRVKTRMEQEREKAEKKALASRANTQGASSPSGGRVSSGEMAPINIANMTEQEKAANWDRILASMSQ